MARRPDTLETTRLAVELLRRIRRKSYIHGSILVRGGLIERESVRPLQK